MELEMLSVSIKTSSGLQDEFFSKGISENNLEYTKIEANFFKVQIINFIQLVNAHFFFSLIRI